MEIQRSTRRGCLVVGFSGRIDLASVATVKRALLKDLSEQPDALICDLAGVRYLDPTAAAVFSTTAKHPAAAGPPPVSCCVVPGRRWPRRCAGGARPI